MISSKSPHHESVIEQMEWGNEKMVVVGENAKLTANLNQARTEAEVVKAWAEIKRTHQMAQLIHMPGVMHFLHQCTKGELWPELWG